MQQLIDMIDRRTQALEDMMYTNKSPRDSYTLGENNAMQREVSFLESVVSYLQSQNKD